MNPDSSVATRVPFIDLRPAHLPIKKSILDDVAALLDRGVFLNGPEIEEFEEAFATYCRVRHCVSVSSGLDALRLALLAVGIEAGDEVIVPAHTFIATFEAVTQAGGTPVPVDVTFSDYNIDPHALSASVGPRTRLLLPVHLYGQLADLRRISDVADRYRLALVEDACQAHGATRDGLTSGAASVAAAFSFYPTKNLGAMGDAGAMVTNDGAVAARVRSLREHGQTATYEHSEVGFTARLDSIQALVLRRKLEFLDRWISDRRHAARRYLELLEGVGDLLLPPIPTGSDPAWHLFVVRSHRTQDLAEFLAARGIGTGRHYPQPPHLSPAYAGLGYRRGSFPITEQIAAQALSLPLYQGITDTQIDVVVTAVRQFFAHG